jgi:hypothetical protein
MEVCNIFFTVFANVAECAVLWFLERKFGEWLEFCGEWLKEMEFFAGQDMQKILVLDPSDQKVPLLFFPGMNSRGV